MIGGGLAGLAASVALAESGWQVRLHEQRPYLGGRATSYVLPDGQHVDNCQHVTFGCCTNLDDFYRRAGSAGKIRFFDRMTLQDPQGRRGVLQASYLPAPLHLVPSFLFFTPLGLRDKLSIARAVWVILRSGGRPADLRNGERVSMLEWLRRRKQTPRAIERFWRAVLVSALAEELDRTDAQYGVDVIWKAVLSNRNGCRMGVPEVPLADLYEQCRITVERMGGAVLLRSPARALRFQRGAFAGVEFDGRAVERAAACVLATPSDVAEKLLPESLRVSDPVFSNLKNLNSSPITGIHLWFDRKVMDEPHLALLDTQTQWIFNKSLLYGHLAEKDATQYLQLVVSASYDFLEKPRQEIIDLCLRELRHALPAARDAAVVKAIVIKEVAATMRPEPGVDRWRLPQQTHIPGLFLAGDWTATGWPATMEGAVRSGYLAAEAVLRAAGEPRQFLQPELPQERLVRFLAKSNGEKS